MQQKHAMNRWLHQVGPAEAFEALAALFPDAAVFSVDADRNILSWSEGAERLLGYSAASVVGQHCLKANRCTTCIRGCGIAEHGEISGVPLALYREDGSVARVRKSGRAFFNADGSFAGGVELLQAESGELPEPAPLADPGESFFGLISQDPAMLQAFRVIRNVAETEASVLVRGESGTGKELVAKAIHELSPRAKGPFVAVNCAALNAQLLESELFGHLRGAFTGAVRDREGLLRQAEGGTLFLDEVAEMPAELQAKLLRALQERVFIPVGSDVPVKVDLRVVAATHRSLRAEVKAGRFREDLMYRLRVVPLFLPPLRDRRGDIELLLKHFLKQASEAGPRRISRVQPEAMRALLEHGWPGNVRELRNVVQYAFAVGRGPELRMEDLPPELREPVEEAVPEGDEAERIREALVRNDGNVGAAAEALGMYRPTF